MSGSSFGQQILEWLFPKFCVQCGRQGTLLCSACYADIEFCPTPIRLELSPCFLASLTAAAFYDGPVQPLIKALKYQSVEEAGKACARLIFHGAYVPECDLLVPVPLHPRRERERGFNQAAIIGKELARLSGVPFGNILIRPRYTTPQARVLSREQRLNRLQDCFILNPLLSVVNRQKISQLQSIVLIDDVCTTGTTLNECARVVRAAGVTQVHALTVAHGG